MRRKNKIIKENLEDNYTLLTDNYSADKINKAIDAGIFIEPSLGKKIELF